MGLLSRNWRGMTMDSMKATFPIICAALAGAIPSFCCAAEPADTAAVAVPEKTSKFRDPQDGAIDLSAYLATPKRFLPIPIVVTEPAVGYGGGLAAMFIRPRKDAGTEGFARPNISGVGGIATENGTWAAFAADSSHWKADRFKTLAIGGVGQANLDFYGLGDVVESLDEPISYTLDFALGLAQGNWKLKPKSPWSIGMRYVYAQVEPKLRDEPLFPGLANSTDMKISAPGAILEYDSRNNLFTPTKGYYSETFYMASLDDLGATEDFQRFQQVVIGWWPVADQWTLAWRADYQWASDDTPFFMRPYIALRGVEAMRYQGDEMASTEVEARWQVRGRWSLVGAAGYGTARTENNFFSKTQDVLSGAVGFRYELARLFGMHAGVDVGFSDGTTAIYLQVGNAWFRP